jgi:hypothetical protein
MPQPRPPDPHVQLRSTLLKGIHGFQAEFRKNETSIYLKKCSALWRDTAQYFCALSDTVPGATEGAELKHIETGDLL